MFLALLFLCILAHVQRSVGVSLEVTDNEINKRAQEDHMALNIPHARESTELQEKVRYLETQIRMLQGIQDNAGEAHAKGHSRFRRDTSGAQILPDQQSSDCVPGTNGCPLTVTPFSIGGSCILCPAGPRGYVGPTGPTGRDGRDGRDSVAIITSDSGETRPPTNTNGPSTNTSGAVYVRWGHTECPSYSTLIYSGTAAGSSYGTDGGGANQLCLPDDPTYDEPVSGVGDYRSFLYSVEYQVNSYPLRDDRVWHDVPCVVCKAPSRFTQLMVPGKNSCPSDDWSLEYGGYLMSERSHSSHKRSMFICVDREMQTIGRTHGVASGNLRGLLNMVESRCASSGGGLPCGPYIDGYEMTCTVCTQ